MKIVVALILCAASAFAQVNFLGVCENTQAVPISNFDADRYQGLWYDVQKYPQDFQPGECSTAFYTIIQPFGIVSVYNTNVLNNRRLTINGSAVLDNVFGRASLRVTFPVEASTIILYTNSPYWVLATDYDNYALVYSCTQLTGTTMSVSAWKLSRNTTLSAAANTAINAIIAAVPTLNQTLFDSTDYSEEACDSSTAVTSSVIAVLAAAIAVVLSSNR